MIYLFYLRNLLIRNPIKLVMIGLIFFLCSTAINLKPQINETHFISKINYESNWLYVIRSDKGEISVLSFNQEPKTIGGNRIVYESTPDAIVPIIIFIVFLLILLIVFSLIPEEDINWQLDEIWEQTQINSISCEIEDDIFYYVYRNRLLKISKVQLSSSDLSNILSRFTYSTLPVFPGTKKERRDKKLKEILS